MFLPQASAMSSAYGHSSRNHFVDPPSIIDRIDGIRKLCWRKPGSSSSSALATSQLRSRPNAIPPSSLLFRIFSVRNCLIILWSVLIWWGERGSFRDSIESCHWHQWEQWHPDAQPHRLVLLTDPQLVDPHTYPTRPWPLSSLTVHHTDLYLRRAFRLIQSGLYPDTTVFLGDLFDGGREWTSNSSHGYAPWSSYKEAFWLKEYKRFHNIFADNFRESTEDLDHHRRFIMTIPGNHDLGFGAGIGLTVRNRFNAFFGDGNRIDVLGNHTLISVDTVSLSALGQADPTTGAQGRGTDDDPDSKLRQIWKPASDFLHSVKEQKGKLGAQVIHRMYDHVDHQTYSHSIHASNESLPSKSESLKPLNVSLPTILLTHVPLYRPPETDCGPLREGRPGLLIERGYQYQNVLASDISTDLIEQVGDVAMVFSGDDHDYCDIIHSSYTGSIREITVKSLSWAMGVRKPGFVQVSLWNPVDVHGRPANGLSQQKTIQTHLCLLPDQLGLFIRYLIAATLSISILFLSNVVYYRPTALLFSIPSKTHRRSASYSSSYPLLPTSIHHSVLSPIQEAENERTPLHSHHPSLDRLLINKQYFPPTSAPNSSSSTSSSSSLSSTSGSNPSSAELPHTSHQHPSSRQTLSSRPSHNTRRSPSPSSGSVRGGYGLPPSQISADAEALALSTSLRAANFGPANGGGGGGAGGVGSDAAAEKVFSSRVEEEKDRYDEWGMPVRSGRRSWRVVLRATVWDVRWVGGVAFLWFAVLVWGDR